MVGREHFRRVLQVVHGSSATLFASNSIAYAFTSLDSSTCRGTNESKALVPHKGRAPLHFYTEDQNVVCQKDRRQPSQCATFHRAANSTRETTDQVQRHTPRSFR